MRNINTYILCLLAISDICYISELGNLSKEKFGKLVKYTASKKKYHSNTNQEGTESFINLLSANDNQNHLYGVVTLCIHISQNISDWSFFLFPEHKISFG